MKFAICNETFQDWPLEKAFAFAKQCGYTGIEFAPFTLGDTADSIPDSKRAEVCQLLQDHGLESLGLHWLLAKTEGFYLTSPEQSVRDKTTEYFKSLARLCRDLNGSIMVLGSPQQRNLLPGVDHDEAMRLAADVIRGAEPTFRELDVTLAIEPLGPAEGDFLLTAEKGIELAKLIDSPNVRLHLDVKAMSSEEKSIPEIIRDSKEYIHHFHANDPNKRGPGMGEMEFTPILQSLQEIDYQGWVSVEVFDYEPGIESLCKDSIDYLKRCLQETE